ncbi:hypothetical protein HH308_20045 [Gordonia sp. TBRC 11910]|uniref:Uncharacterized protein n=1 Tax=Gordonia asplenii TaxID=2725283 RepID=A0A848L4K0_9ACTN|nr:hypothetical protein [Gordonia asplenii]NMO03511.1 hypothetical protein [Gordonia asplenii]
MTETATLPNRPPTTVSIVIDDDATPIVRLIGRTLDAAARTGHASDVFDRSSGTVVVRSHNTPQCATIVFDDGRVTVAGGVSGEPDATLVVDVDNRFAPRTEPAADSELADDVQRALRPAPPAWRDAAARFWALTRDIHGIPDVLIVTVDGPDGPEQAQFGAGPDRYRMSGRADVLAGVFSGADYLIDALSAGLAVQGTLSQLSVMTAASWKVRFDV